MSRSPLMLWVRRSADSAMNKFISAMPSSICWPVGEKSQLNVEGIRSLLNVSAKTSRANRPRRLTHEPRRVVARNLIEQRAKTGLRRRFLLGRHRQIGRHRDAGSLQTALAAAGKRHAV